MSFSRGKYGVEYHRSETETHRLRGFVILALVLTGICFASYRITRWWRSRPAEPPSSPHVVPTPPPRPPKPVATTVTKPETPPPATPISPAPPAIPVTTTPVQPVLPPPRPIPTVPPTVRPLVQELLESESARPQADQILIRRYAEAERQGNVRNAIDTITKLFDRPSMADQSNALKRRLGDLNLQMLLSGKSTPWTKTVTVRRGDGRERIAREHRTTTAALIKLNPKTKWEKLRPGDTVTVLEFPNAILVIHKQTNTADLSLRGGKFFRRYDISISKTAVCDIYPITPETGATLHARYRELGVKLSPSDRAELEMFLGPGSRITVTEQ